jgi:purine-cytosine permease-like protein
MSYTAEERPHEDLRRRDASRACALVEAPVPCRRNTFRRHFDAMTPRALPGIETRSVDWVPLAERHGRVADQGRFWFLANFHFFTIAVGFIGPGMGLGLGWTVLAGTLGILIGTVFQAFHASQGAEMGLPQMVQSRAQFGYRGVILPLAVTLFIYVGFNVANTVLVAGSLSAMEGWNRMAVGLSVSLAAALLAVWGHDVIHIAFKWLFRVSVPLFAVLSLAILVGLRVKGGHPVAAGGFSAVAFATQLAAGASYNLTYAPYVSDYSRYLPPSTPRARVIASVFLGASVSAIWLVALGAWLATRLGGEDALACVAQAGNLLLPGFGALLAGVSVAVLVAAMGVNAYSGMLTVVTAADCFSPVRPTRALRIACVAVLAVLWTALAGVVGGHAIAVLDGALVLMLYFLVPWTAINLVDYFFVRRGRYAVTQLFMPHGIYGAWRADGLAAYALGFVASLPFAVLPGLGTGSAARALGGVDVGWLVGLVVTAVCYLAFTWRFDPACEDAAVAESWLSLGEEGRKASF